MILKRLLARKSDMQALSKVLSKSLAIAQLEGAQYAGAQHLLLAALDMEDGTARRAFEQAGADPDAFAAAVDAQHSAAIPQLKMPAEPMIESVEDRALPAQPKPDATYDAAVRATHEFHNSKGNDGAKENGGVRGNGGAFSGAYMVAGVASLEDGAAARALTAMGVDAHKLTRAALDVARG